MISIIVPVYKVEKYLGKCIESICNQSYRDIEIILVDDGSPDRCPEICDMYSKKDERIRVVHKQNGGLSSARNAGLSIARGEYIGFVDSDDYIAPDMYEKMYKTAVSTNSEMVICNFTYIYEGTAIPLEQDPRLESEETSGREIMKRLTRSPWAVYVVAWNKLYKRELWEGLKYPEGRYHEDEYVIHELLYRVNTVGTISEPLYYYLQRDSGIMRSNIANRSLDYLDAAFERWKFYKEKGLVELMPDLVGPIQRSFDSSMLHYCAKSLDERQRVKKTKETFRKIFFSIAENHNVFNHIKYQYPRSTIRLMYMMKKLRKGFAKGRIFLRCAIRCIGAKYILIDTPTHGNLGDHAIVLAEEKILSESNGGKYAEITAAEFDRCGSWLARLIPAKRDILVHGGGFLGAIWPQEEQRFHKILNAFSKQRVIVFPQTITFYMDTEQGRSFFEQSKNAYQAHPDLTVFVREQKSYEFMQEFLPKIRCELVPDVVTSYTLDLAQGERHGVLLCMRADREKKISEANLKQIMEKVSEKYPDDQVEMTDTVVDYQIMPQQRFEIVKKKLEQFSHAKLIVTDRLHGMIFAAITNTPCIALGNSNGKVQGVYQWIRHNEYVQYADNMEEFECKLDQLKGDMQCSYDWQPLKVYFDKLKEVITNK